MRALLDEGSIDFAGDFYAYSGVSTAARPVQEHLPLKIGAMGGPRSMELAGEIADGLCTACAYSTEALRYVIDCFDTGVARAGRTRSGLDVSDSLLGAIGPDAAVAKQAGRTLAAFYIPSMPQPLLDRHGISSADAAPIREAFAAGDVQGALAVTPDSIADRLVVAGTPDDWLRYLTETYAAAGFDHALVSFADVGRPLHGGHRRGHRGRRRPARRVQPPRPETAPARMVAHGSRRAGGVSLVSRGNHRAVRPR